MASILSILKTILNVKLFHSESALTREENQTELQEEGRS